MKELLNTLKKHDLRTKSYLRKGHVVIIDSNKGKLVFKKKNNSSIYEYLNSRSFNYYPPILYDNNYEITKYIENIDMPVEQKMLDLINLVSLLHNKTTFYKNIDVDEYKKNYEDLKGNISYLTNYYNDLMTNIESKIYLSPCEYLLSANISIVFDALNYCSIKLDEWYKNIKDKNRRRYVIIHNNLDLNHFIRNEKSYLISWNKSKIDIPVYDLYILYKKYAITYDFKEILLKYEKNYPLLEEEKNLLYILISLPDKVELNSDNYNNCVKVEKLIEYLHKTEKIISPNNSKDTK